MSASALLPRVLTAISVITVLSGITQMVNPGLILGLIGAQTAPAARHFFAIIGMFMLLFGGALLHELRGPVRQPIVALWAGFQKLGAFAAVSLGVVLAIFSPLALLVAGFDLLSGVLILWYWHIHRSAR